MNIFYLSHCPKKAAQVQYNKHVVKMILETAQLLCTAHHELGTSIDIPYKAHIKIIRQLYGLDHLLKHICGHTNIC